MVFDLFSYMVKYLPSLKIGFKDNNPPYCYIVGSFKYLQYYCQNIDTVLEI